MVRNITIGAPPGTITKGMRAPNFQGPKRLKQRPHATQQEGRADQVDGECGDRPSALATRNTEVIGTAAITSTCCRPKQKQLRYAADTVSTG